MFPDRVGHFVLDSPVNLSVSSDQELVDDANGFEHALDSFLADCAARPKCSFHSHGDPASALHALQQQFEQGLTLRGDTLAGDKRRVACRRLLHRADLRALRQAVRLARARRRVARRHRAQGRLDAPVPRRQLQRPPAQRHLRQHQRSHRRDPLRRPVRRHAVVRRVRRAARPARGRRTRSSATTRAARRSGATPASRDRRRRSSSATSGWPAPRRRS